MGSKKSDRSKRVKLFALLTCFILLPFSPALYALDTFTYDANGNLVQDSTSGRCFEYNGAHKLKKVTDCQGNTLAQYWYDDVGKKVKAVEGDVTILYWSDEQVEVIGGPDHGNYTYFFANGERIARMNPNGSMYYYHNDHLGSTSVITDDQGNVVEKTKYYPYGEVRSGGNATAYLYNSKELDPITGQYDYRARPYDPTSPPRFTQPDPLIPDVYNPQSLNRYSYVKNNPLKYVDPTGNQYQVYAYNAGVYVCEAFTGFVASMSESWFAFAVFETTQTAYGEGGLEGVAVNTAEWVFGPKIIGSTGGKVGALAARVKFSRQISAALAKESPGLYNSLQSSSKTVAAGSDYGSGLAKDTVLMEDVTVGRYFDEVISFKESKWLTTLETTNPVEA